MHLTTLDWIVVVGFVGAILAIGFSARVRESSVLQFLSAGRSLSLPAFVATLVSTWYGGILGIGESVSYYGVGTWLLLGVPYYIFAVAYAIWLAPRVRDAVQISIPERLRDRYDHKTALLGAGLVFLLAVPAAHVLMLGVLVRELSGMALVPSILLASVVGTAFLYRGGLLADVRVGFLAFVAMYVGFGVIVVAGMLRMPPNQVLASVTPEQASFTGGTYWPTWVSYLVLGLWTMVDPGFHQRVAVAESPAVGRRGVLISVVCWLVFDLLSITTGMYALTMLKPPPDAPLAIFPRLGDQILPPGLKGLFLCGMLGTITSAMVGYTLVAGATLGREVVASLRRMSDAATKRSVQIGFAVATVVAVGLAVNIQSVVTLWYAWAGAVVGAILLPTALAYGPRPPRANVAFAAMGLAFAVALGWLIVSVRTNNPLQEVVWIQNREGGYLTLPPVPKGPESAGTVVTTFSLGTLLPGLVISGLVIGLGEALGRRNAKHDRQS